MFLQNLPYFYHGALFKQLDSIQYRQSKLNVTAHFIFTNVKVNVCYLAACITTITADSILGNSKGINAQINVLHGFRDS